MPIFPWQKKKNWLCNKISSTIWPLKHQYFYSSKVANSYKKERKKVEYFPLKISPDQNVTVPYLYSLYQLQNTLLTYPFIRQMKFIGVATGYDWWTSVIKGQNMSYDWDITLWNPVMRKYYFFPVLAFLWLSIYRTEQYFLSMCNPHLLYF